MKLRAKITLITTVTVLLLNAAAAALAYFLLMRDFRRLDEAQALTVAASAARALRAEVEGLKRINRDYGDWDETYNFARAGGRSPAFVASGLDDSLFSNLRINYLLITSPRGDVLYARGFDYRAGTVVDVPRGLSEAMTAPASRLRAAASTHVTAGVLPLPDVTLLVAAGPVMRSDGGGPSAGALLVGKTLDADVTASMREACGAPVVWYRLDRRPLPPDVDAGYRHLDKTGKGFRAAGDGIYSYACVTDVYGADALLLRTYGRRAIIIEGRRAIMFLVAALVAASIIITALTLLVVNQTVFAKLTALGDDVARIGARRDFAGRVKTRSQDDEVGILAAKTNAALASLERAQAELGASEQRYRALAESIPVGVFRFNARSGAVVATNQAGAALFGYKSAEEVVVHLTWKGFVPAEYSAHAAGQLAADGVIPGWEVHLRRHDGGEFWGVVAARVSPGEDGKPHSIDAVVQDITALRAMEENLRIKDDALEALLNAFALLDADGRFIYVNRAFKALWDVPDTHGVLGSYAFPFIWPDGRGSDAWEALRREGRWVGEAEGRRGDDSPFFAYVSANVVVGLSDGVVRYSLSAVDITDRRQAEDKLRYSEERFRLLTAVAPDAVVMTDGDGLVTYWNPAAEAIFGYEKSDIEGKPLRDFIVPPDRRTDSAGIMTGFVETGAGAPRGQMLEYEALRRGGEVFPAEISVSNAQIRGRWFSIGIVRDATARKKAETELRRARDELELRVAERTSELDDALARVRAEMETRGEISAALRESESLYRTLVSASPDGILVLDLGGSVSFASQRAAEIFALAPPATLLGERLWGRVASEDREAVTAAVAAARRDGAFRGLECRFRRGSQSEWFAAVNLALIRDEVDAPRAFITTVRDITERQQAETALRESEEKYRTVVEQVNAGVFVIQDGVIRYANRYGEERLRVAAGAIVGRGFEELLTPASAEEARRRYVERLAGYTAASVYEATARTPAGEEFPVEIHSSSVQYGGRTASIVIVHDLTEKSEKERLVREQRWVLENVLNNVPDLVYVVDPATNAVLFVNETAAGKLGPDVVGSECHRVVAGLDAPCRRCPARFVSSAVPSNGTVAVDAYNNQLGQWCRYVGKRVTWHDGREVVCMVMTDITERKDLEAAIIARNRALSAALLDRDSALARKNRELVAVAEFLAADLRDPLRALEECVLMLEKDYGGALDERGRDNLRRLARGTGATEARVGALLAHTRLGTLMALGRVDMRALADKSLKDLERLIAVAGADVTVGELPFVEGDATLMAVVWTNLLDNALRYRRDGVAPAVAVSGYEAEGKCVYAVADNGPGLDPWKAEQVFDILYRLRANGGTRTPGVGLANAKKAVMAHDGRIWYESEMGHGTTFFFEIPAFGAGGGSRERP